VDCFDDFLEELPKVELHLHLALLSEIEQVAAGRA
jgi:hypothetical protein